jgi:hypothetical protein
MEDNLMSLLRSASASSAGCYSPSFASSESDSVSFTDDESSVSSESVSSSSTYSSFLGKRASCSHAPVAVAPVDDLATKQRRRRHLRMEIMRKKREKKLGVLASRSSSPVSLPGSFSSASPVSSSFDEECVFLNSSYSSAVPETPTNNNPVITDPQLLRKLRNRESAARSRQKIIDMIDSLTCDLCDRFVTLKDLQEQHDYLQVNTTPVSSSVAVASSDNNELYSAVSMSSISSYCDLDDLLNEINDCSDGLNISGDFMSFDYINREMLFV